MWEGTVAAQAAQLEPVGQPLGELRGARGRRDALTVTPDRKPLAALHEASPWGMAEARQAELAADEDARFRKAF